MSEEPEGREPGGERRKAEIAIAKLIDRIAGLARENGLSSVANILDMASFLARTERKAEANPPEHDTTEHVSEHEAAERAAENDTTEQHEATEKATEGGAECSKGRRRSDRPNTRRRIKGPTVGEVRNSISPHRGRLKIDAWAWL